jgi:hypothetical protein
MLSLLTSTPQLEDGQGEELVGEAADAGAGRCRSLPVILLDVLAASGSQDAPVSKTPVACLVLSNCRTLPATRQGSSESRRGS